MRDLMDLREKEHFIATRRGVLDPKTLSKEDYQKLIHEKPAYGQIICRCEQVTEGEILDAIHRPLGEEPRRRQAPYPRRHGPLPGGLLQPARDGDPGARTSR